MRPALRASRRVPIPVELLLALDAAFGQRSRLDRIVDDDQIEAFTCDRAADGGHPQPAVVGAGVRRPPVGQRVRVLDDHAPGTLIELADSRLFFKAGNTTTNGSAPRM